MAFLDYLSDPGTQAVLRSQALDHAVLTAVVMVAGAVIGLTLGVIAHRVAWLHVSP